MPVAPSAALLRHRGHGPLHCDLVLGRGVRCPTLSFRRAGRGWRGGWNAPHRRRYLTYAGPVGGGRGVVCRCWRGPARWWKAPGGAVVALPGAQLRLRGSAVECRGWLATLPRA